jgi:hypothetical protein
MDTYVLQNIFDRLPQDMRINTIKYLDKECYQLYKNNRFDLGQPLPNQVLNDFVISGYFTPQVFTDNWNKIHNQNKIYLFQYHIDFILDLAYLSVEAVCIDGTWFNKRDSTQNLRAKIFSSYDRACIRMFEVHHMKYINFERVYRHQIDAYFPEDDLYGDYYDVYDTYDDEEDDYDCDETVFMTRQRKTAAKKSYYKVSKVNK